MLSEVDFELTNFINPELTWKKVKKGYRSTNRCGRKLTTRSLNFGMDLGNKSRKMEQDSSVFESEKHGANVLGRRISEKAVVVPIKKRKVLFRHPSPPPQTPSPDHEESLSPQLQTAYTHTEESEHVVDSMSAPDSQQCSQVDHLINNKYALNSSVGIKYEGQNGTVSEVANGEHRYIGDFSGIQLLAATTCTSNNDDDGVIVKEAYVVEEFAKPGGIDLSCSAIPTKESIPSSGTDSLWKDVNVKEASEVEESAKPEGMDLSCAAKPSKESIPSSGTDSLRKDLLCKDDTTVSSVKDITDVSFTLHTNEHVAIVESCVPSKDERLHWDLNTVMDAWENPYNDPIVNYRISNSEHVNDGMQSEKLTLGRCEFQSNLDGVQCDIESEMQSVVFKKVSSDNQMLLDSNSLVHATLKYSTQENSLNASIEKEYVTVPTEFAREPLNYAISDKLASTSITITDFSNNYCSPGYHQIANGRVSAESRNNSSVVEQMGEDSDRTCVAEIGKSLSGDFQDEKIDVFSTEMPHSNKFICEINDIQAKDCEDSGKTPELLDSRTSRLESNTFISNVDSVNFLGESDKTDNFNSSPKCEALSSSSTSIKEDQSAVIGEVKHQDDRTSAIDNNNNTSYFRLMANSYRKLVLSGGTQQGEVISQGSCKSSGDADVPTNCTVKVAPENHLSDCYGSDVTQDGHMVGVDNIVEHEAGYVSSFAGGELRGPDVYSWQENEVEEGETECVDYGSDNGDRDAVDYSMSENFEVDREGYQISKKVHLLAKKSDNEMIKATGNRSALDDGSFKSFEQYPKGDVSKEKNRPVSLKAIISSGDQFMERCEYGVAEGNDEGHDDKGLFPGDLGSRASRGKLTYHSKGKLPFGLLDKKYNLPVQRNRSDNLHYSFSRAEKDFGFEKNTGRDRFSFKGRGRNEEDGHWVASAAAGYRDTRNRPPHSYRSPDLGYSRSRAFANSGTKVVGLNCHDDRRYSNYSTNVYRPFMRSTSPVDRDDSYGGPRESPPVRGIIRDRSRGRSGLYAKGTRRVPKEDYREDVPDESVPCVRRPHNFTRRGQGFSSNYSRGTHFTRPRRNSRSRSRTRSPLAWHLQKDRNAGPRRHSPDFSSDARIEVKPTFQKPSFAIDSEENFMSSPRSRLSPHSNNRWFDDGNCINKHFRQQKSPPRLFRRSQRFDSIGYSGRLKSDSFFRSMIHRGRLPQVAGTARGHDFEDSDDERSKQDERYEMSHRVRCYDAGGAVRRFGYDTEGCFEAHNPQIEDYCYRGAIKRDALRSSREERGPRYNSNRIYSNASSSGQWDYDEDAATREE